MESLAPVVRNALFELNQNTVENAAEIAAQRVQELIDANSSGMMVSMGGSWKIDKDKFKKFIEKIDNPARKKRFIKLYKEGKLADYILRQKHYFSTLAGNKMEWFRDNTDISISPEFYDGAYSAGYKNTDREPTKDEHDFYRYCTSMGTDTEGISKENLKRYRAAFCRFYKEQFGVDDIYNMVPKV